MNRRLRITKSILWALVGVGAVVTVVRFLNGLGAITNLSDAAPWGLWIAFDVMGGVALAAGGFVLAATVYIFGLERYRPFVRPAILTAFLGYAAVAVGLLYDLGLPWNIWHPIIYPQHHSVLFEVAMCVMLYLTVLALEFAPVILEHPWFDRPLFRSILGILKRGTIVLVIAGIMLSTLHQSSLGSLFLIAPDRLHPLWYSSIIYVLFFVSAVGLGLMTVVAESLISGWLLGHEVRTDLLSGLGLAASFVLGLYALLRIADLAISGGLVRAFDGSSLGFLFLFEIGVCAIIPAALLSMKRVRTSIAGLAVCSGMTIFGMVLYRFSVCLFAFKRPAGMGYFPTWTEIAVSLGIVAGATLVFLFFVENLKVYPEETGVRGAGAQAWRPSYDPATIHSLTPESLAAPRRYSFMVVFAAAIAVLFLSHDAVFGPQPLPTPVSGVRTVTSIKAGTPNKGVARFSLVGLTDVSSGGGRLTSTMLIDGNRDGQAVFFTHKHHIDELGGEESCVQCHHQNMPFDQNTACSECHRDMYEPTDIFSHTSHVDHLGGNDGCARCHDPASQEAKTRETATACVDCHADMLVEGSFIENPQERMKGIAPGYMEAMHKDAGKGPLCVGCHEKMIAEEPEKFDPAFAECSACHGPSENSDLEKLGPYVTRAAGPASATDLVRVDSRTERGRVQ